MNIWLFPPRASDTLSIMTGAVIADLLGDNWNSAKGRATVPERTEVTVREQPHCWSRDVPAAGERQLMDQKSLHTAGPRQSQQMAGKEEMKESEAVLKGRLRGGGRALFSCAASRWEVWERHLTSVPLRGSRSGALGLPESGHFLGLRCSACC